MPLDAALHEALVVASHGRNGLVETADGSRHSCQLRGKKTLIVVGDRVLWRAGHGSGVIERVLPRRNFLHRQDALRSRVFAANLDQVLILLGALPTFSETLLARALIAAAAAGVAALIALNKQDLPEFAAAWHRLRPYRAHPELRHTVLPLCLQTGAGLEALRQQLAGSATLVLGPSGAGKSTLVNALVPGAAARVGALSQALASGRHTTSAAHWYWVDAQRTTALVDSPGFQEFGLHHIAARTLAQYMPDIGQHAARCRFHNCTHRHEPGCAVLAEIKDNWLHNKNIDFINDYFYNSSFISETRYQIYETLLQELEAAEHAAHVTGQGR